MSRSLNRSSSAGTAVMVTPRGRTSGAGGAPEAGAAADAAPSGVKMVDPEVLKMAEAWVGYKTTSNPLLFGGGGIKGGRTSVGELV